MLSIKGKDRIFFYQKSIDMKKSFEGLSQAVVETFGEELTSGAYFVFLNKRRDHVKILYWDLDGFAIWYKRLAEGTFLLKPEGLLTRRDLVMMLEGIKPLKLSHRYNL